MTYYWCPISKRLCGESDYRLTNSSLDLCLSVTDLIQFISSPVIWKYQNKLCAVIEWRWWILSSVMKYEKWTDQYDTSVEQRKVWVSDRNRAHDLLNTVRVLVPLSYENWWRARSFNWVHMWPCSPWVIVAQWIERPPGVQEVASSIPVEDSNFFFVPRSCLVDQFTFHKLWAVLRWNIP